jgi:protein-arginine kinase activator protein McsA
MSEIEKLATKKYHPEFSCTECGICFNNPYNWKLGICPSCYETKDVVLKRWNIQGIGKGKQ